MTEFSRIGRNLLLAFELATAAITPSVLESVVAPTELCAMQKESPKKKINLTEILTAEVYTDKFIPNPGVDEEVASELYKYSLQDLVSKNIVSSKNSVQKDLWLPMGIKNGKKKIDFYKGMSDCWNDKITKNMKKLTKKQLQQLKSEMNESLVHVKKGSNYSLRDFRKNEVSEGITVLKGLIDNYVGKHYTKDNTHDKEMRRLFATIKEKLTPNVLLGYAIHEMMPPGIEGEKINAVSKAYFVDRMFKEGGSGVIERFPARYDKYLSYGPFQMTKFAMGAVKQYNKYVNKSEAVPTDMARLSGLKDHVNSAVVFAFSNWKMFGEYLAKKSLLKDFNDGLEDMNERNQKILIAGITSCMHHQPAITMKRTANYVDRRSMKNMHYDIYTSLPKQLDKYYKSAAEAYLAMKVFDLLDDNYTAKR